MATLCYEINKQREEEEKKKMEEVDKKKQFNYSQKFNYPQKFRKAWLQDPKLKDWLRENVNKPHKSYCIYCKCELISKYCDLRNHATTKKHLRAAVASQQQQLTDSLPMVMKSMTNEMHQKIEISTDHIEIESSNVKTEQSKRLKNLCEPKSMDSDNEQETSIDFHEPLHVECLDEEDQEFTEILNLADNEFETMTNTTLQEKRMKAEIAYFQQKTEYFAKLTENTKIHKTLMLLQARKLNLEIKKMQNEF